MRAYPHGWKPISDPVEREYGTALHAALAAGDSDAAHELAVGLRQYRESYKVPLSTSASGDAGAAS